MKKLLMALCLLSSSVNAATLKGGYVVCATQDLFDRATYAQINQDDMLWAHLMSNGCAVLNGGSAIEIIEVGYFSGVAKVRLILSEKTGESIEVFTNVENIN